MTDVIKLGPNDTSLTPCSLLRHLSSLHMSQYQWYYLHTKYNFTYKWEKKSLINASYKILSYSGNDGFILGRLDGNLTISDLATDEHGDSPKKGMNIKVYKFHPNFFLH